MRIRLLIADVDGTLVTPEKKVTTRTKDALARMRSAGVLFSITSGRPPRGMLKLAEELGLTTPMAAFNGGMIVRPDLEVLAERTIPPGVSMEVIDFLESAGIDVWVYRGVDWFVRRLGVPHMEKEQWNVGFAPSVVPDVRKVAEGAVKIVGVSDDAPLLTKCEDELRRRVGAYASATRSQRYYLDVTHADANKGMVVRLSSLFLRIPLDEIAVIGDMPNDVLMFGVAGTSIAMGNASPEVQRTARYVTTSNAEEGFANAVERYVLRPSPTARIPLGLPPRTRACVFALEGVLTGDSGRKARPDAIGFVRKVREAGLRTAVVSSSPHAEEELEAAGLADLFDARIDGRRADAEHLAREPAPDLLLAAARALGVSPSEAAVFEDALPGVEAGRAGHFGYVVGIDRGGQGTELRWHGADAVVSGLSALLESP